MQATQLLSIPSYFAITRHHDYFESSSTEDLHVSNCVQSFVMMYTFNVLFYPFTFADCTMILFAIISNKLKNFVNLGIYLHCKF